MTKEAGTTLVREGKDGYGNRNLVHSRLCDAILIHFTTYGAIKNDLRTI